MNLFNISGELRTDVSRENLAVSQSGEMRTMKPCWASHNLFFKKFFRGGTAINSTAGISKAVGSW